MYILPVDMVRATSFDLLREQLWLQAHEILGLNQTQIGALAGLTQSQVSRRLDRARQLRLTPKELRALRCELIESANPIATHGCERHHVIAIGDEKVCLGCGFSGLDHIAPFSGVTPLPADKKPPAPGMLSRQLKQAKRSARSVARAS